MSGRAEFQARAAKLYDGLAHSWLTPSELFSPFYGAAGTPPLPLPCLHSPPPHSLPLPHPNILPVARWAAEHVTGLRHVIEVGPGNGTFAIDFLDAMKRRYPSLYSSLRYTAVDASLSHARTLASTLKVGKRLRHTSLVTPLLNFLRFTNARAQLTWTSGSGRRTGDRLGGRLS